jgi:hypothetical protein
MGFQNLTSGERKRLQQGILSPQEAIQVSARTGAEDRASGGFWGSTTGKVVAGVIVAAGVVAAPFTGGTSIYGTIALTTALAAGVATAGIQAYRSSEATAGQSELRALQSTSAALQRPPMNALERPQPPDPAPRPVFQTGPTAPVPFSPATPGVVGQSPPVFPSFLSTMFGSDETPTGALTGASGFSLSPMLILAGIAGIFVVFYMTRR